MAESTSDISGTKMRPPDGLGSGARGPFLEQHPGPNPGPASKPPPGLPWRSEGDPPAGRPGNRGPRLAHSPAWWPGTARAPRCGAPWPLPGGNGGGGCGSGDTADLREPSEPLFESRASAQRALIGRRRGT